MNIATPGAAERTRAILEDLEAVRENLLALSDDIWDSIEHNDPEALEEGVDFKRAYNTKAAEFDRIATEISNLVQRYTSISLESAEETGSDDRQQNERIVAELNREQPHAINEDFTFKRPHGFILQGQGTTGVKTWQRIYELICRELYRRDPARFRGLHDDPDLVTNRGNPTVSEDPAILRKALPIADGVYVEANHSANALRNVLQKLLAAYDVPLDEVRIFLREDRDAGGGDHVV